MNHLARKQTQRAPQLPWRICGTQHGTIIDFDYEHAGMVETCKRKQIIVRGANFKKHNLLYLVCGRGSTNCRRLRSTQVDSVQSVFIDSKSIIVDNHVLQRAEADQFAQQDGFAYLEAFLNFYKNTQGLPIEGQVVRWL